MNGPLGAGRICIKMAPALRSSAEISAKGSAGIIICQGRRARQSGRFKVSRGLSARSREKEPHLRIRRCERREREALIECGAHEMRWTTKVAESKCGFVKINS